MISIVATLIKKNNQYLLVQEKKAEAFGLWTIPAGRIKEGETPEEAACRETKEETGLLLKLQNLIKTFKYNSLDTKIYVFRARIADGKVKLNPKEFLKIGWFSLEEIEKLPLRKNFILEAIRLDKN